MMNHRFGVVPLFCNTFVLSAGSDPLGKNVLSICFVIVMDTLPAVFKEKAKRYVSVCQLLVMYTPRTGDT